VFAMAHNQADNSGFKTHIIGHKAVPKIVSIAHHHTFANHLQNCATLLEISLFQAISGEIA